MTLARCLLLATVRVSFTERAGTLDTQRIGPGEGDLSPEPMWDDRMGEIRELRPRLIRLFLQEYFDLFPARRRYYFDTLDRNVDLILKPRLLFAVNQDVVERNGWTDWADLVYQLVKHYQGPRRGHPVLGSRNEPDIGDDGTCPYRFKPDNYVTYYQHTAAAILRADLEARVGGPALANVRSPLLPALIAAAVAGKAPVHFVSWHIYSSEPARLRETVQYVRVLLAKHPNVKVETFLDEWNMSLSNPVRDLRFQPAYVNETAWQMMGAGLDYSCYYHIRDYCVDLKSSRSLCRRKARRSWRAGGIAWPSMTACSITRTRFGPARYSFKLLSRLAGERLRLASGDADIHGFFTWDLLYRTHNLPVWNEMFYRSLRNSIGDRIAPDSQLLSQLPTDPERSGGCVSSATS